MACARKNPLLLVERKTCRRRKEIDLLVHACHSISFCLFSLFLIFLFFFIFSSFISACFSVVIFS